MESDKAKPSGNLTQEIIDLLAAKLKQLKQYATLDPSNGWKFKSEKKGLKIHTRKDKESGYKWVRGEAVINTTPTDIIERVLYSPTDEAKYDSTLEEMRDLEKVSGYIFTYTLGKKPNVLVSARDTVICNRWLKQDGVIYCIGTSVEHPDMPERPGIVRADVIIWGYVLTPLPNDPNKTTMTYILATHAKGKVPKALVNWFISEQADGVAKIKDWIDKNPKEQRKEK